MGIPTVLDRAADEVPVLGVVGPEGDVYFRTLISGGAWGMCGRGRTFRLSCRPKE